ncbi:MAG: radical SAM protein, partial [bacterium]|nr:radical SAM protein [bacterium]
MKIISIFLPYLGCQQRCIFCNQQILNDVFVAPAEIQIRKKISAAIDTLPKGGDAEIAFFGCSFTSMPLDKQEMYLKIADEFKDSVNGIRISAHPNSFPKEVIRLLKKYDVTTVELGVESMSSAVLKESGRKYSSDDIINNIKVLKSAGLKVVGQLMLGLPGDTKRRFIKSVKDLADTKIDFIRLHPTLVLKNTDLEVKYIQNEYQPLSLEEALEWLLDAFDVLEESKIP